VAFVVYVSGTEMVRRCTEDVRAIVMAQANSNGDGGDVEAETGRLHDILTTGTAK
jgi:hypothetical protein